MFLTCIRLLHAILFLLTEYGAVINRKGKICIFKSYNERLYRLWKSYESVLIYSHIRPRGENPAKGVKLDVGLWKRSYSCSTAPENSGCVLKKHTVYEALFQLATYVIILYRNRFAQMGNGLSKPFIETDIRRIRCAFLS